MTKEINKEEEARMFELRSKAIIPYYRRSNDYFQILKYIEVVEEIKKKPCVMGTMLISPECSDALAFPMDALIVKPYSGTILPCTIIGLEWFWTLMSSNNYRGDTATLMLDNIGLGSISKNDLLFFCPKHKNENKK